MARPRSAGGEAASIGLVSPMDKTCIFEDSIQKYKV
jgi:hypothetical protein